MIYEILVRPAYNKMMTSDHLVWIESDLPTRIFEQWLRDSALLDGTPCSPIVRWGIVKSDTQAHYELATQENAIQARIAELTGGAIHLMPVPLVHAMRQVEAKAAVLVNA